MKGYFMAIKLPKEFVDQMQEFMGEEWENLYKSYNMDRFYGLRVNTLKISLEEFRKISLFNLSTIPWTRDGFYYEEGEQPTKHPHYYAGLYYIQEPSAMFPAEVLDCKPGERVLDLCAAPGGKSVQIAAGMKGQGLLVSNDINSDRVKPLVKNLEVCGVRNVVATCEKPEMLAKKFPEFFDKIMVDAPCSGEGMFRKDPEAATSWGKYKNEVCSKMQWEILCEVDKMLCEGGTFVYSTCTFHPDENERMIENFLDKYSNYELDEIKKVNGIDGGRTKWTRFGRDMSGVARLWPHKLNGEGHFVAKLRKKMSIDKIEVINNKNINFLNPKELIAFREFEQEHMKFKVDERILKVGSNIYRIPDGIDDFDRLKIIKFGWYLGELVNNRFIPSHVYLMGINIRDINKRQDFSSTDPDVIRYLKGETLISDGEKGYVAVTVDGNPLGWAKRNDGVLKNLYPKGWRKMV